MSAVLQSGLTADDLLTMPEGDRFEFVDGELLETEMGADANWVAGEVFGHLRSYARQHGGWAFPETQFRIYSDDPNRVRKPDVSYVAAGCFSDDRIPQGFITVAPALAVEVVSPSDVYYEVEAKVEEYLTAGVPMVWVVNPQNRTVRVFLQEGRPQQLRAEDQLTGGELLPGLSLRVGDLFSAAGGKD